MSRPRTLRESIAIAPEIAASDSFSAESAQDKEDAQVVRRGILIRVTPETWRALKVAAIERGTTMQVLMLEGIEFVLNRHDDDAPAPGRQAGR